MKYWAYVNNEILGPFEKGKLLELPSFSPSLLVCPQTPVGEKTEDWKEASTYPELSALIGQDSMAHTPAAAAADVLTVAPESFTPPPSAQPAPAPAPAPEPLAKPLESHSLSFKPLTASKSLDPVPPTEHAPAGINIASNRLGKAGGEHTQAAQSQQFSSVFDPISLSRIERRSEAMQVPHKASGQQAAESPSGQNQPEPDALSQQDSSAAAPAPVTDLAGLESLVQRLDAISRNSATRQDINSAVDPLRMKLDQMGEVISSIKNSQFQREVMDKLVYLENAVGELKVAFKNPLPTPAPAMAQKMEMEKNSDTVFSVQPVKQAEKPKAEPAKEAAKPAEMADTGSKPSRLVPTLKKIFRLIITLVLLAAVLVGTVIGLKNFGVFDATKFIPFPIPFLSAPNAQPQQTGAEAQKAALAAMEELNKEAPLEQQAQQPGEQEPRPATPEPLQADLATDNAGKAAFEALARKSEAKPPRKSPKKGAAKPAPKPRAKKAAPKKQAAPEEEYEYEYVEDDGTEQ